MKSLITNATQNQILETQTYVATTRTLKFPRFEALVLDNLRKIIDACKYPLLVDPLEICFRCKLRYCQECHWEPHSQQ